MGLMAGRHDHEAAEIACRPLFSRRDFPVGEDPSCFVIMPFHVPLLEEIYRSYVKPTIEALGISCVRGDDVFSTNAIMEDIWSSICTAHIVIGEFTGRNPNVLYEAGIAHTVGKPLVGITQKLEDVPFDFRHRRIIEYQNSPSGYVDLERRLKATVANLLRDGVVNSPRPIEDFSEREAALWAALRDERDRTNQIYRLVEKRQLSQTRHFIREVARRGPGRDGEFKGPAFCEVPSAVVSVDHWDSERECVVKGESIPVGDFLIGKYPVTNREYLSFVLEVGHYPPEHWTGPEPAKALWNLPVVGLSWNDVTVYCEWLAGKLGRSVRIPTEAEWLAAAGYAGDGPIYPWGREWGEGRCNSKELGVRGHTPVTQFDSFLSPTGCVDMLGNVWEWTSDVYEGGEGFGWRAVRGGANYTDLKGVGVLARLVAFPGHFLFVRDLGLRVVAVDS
jgi:hypothetical protein